MVTTAGEKYIIGLSIDIIFDEKYIIAYRLISSSIHLFFKTGYLLRLTGNMRIFLHYELRYYKVICFSDCVNYITVRDITSWSPALVDKLKKANRSVLYQLYS
jgi:hypothetical protein